MARRMGACAKLLELLALPFLKSPVANRETGAVAHVGVRVALP